jgi:hypothetical protein
VTLEAKDVEKPICKYGYTREQIRRMLGDDTDNFTRWMYGATMTLCEGKEYNHLTGEYEPCCNGVAHGPVVYPWDLETYLRGLDPLD